MKRLLLLGGGHAQLQVLARLAERPLPACDVRLVTPYRRQIYSGCCPAGSPAITTDTRGFNSARCTC